MVNNKCLSVENVCFSYEKGIEILHDISITFPEEKITALIGANGCGKSTLLNLLTGVHRPDSGMVRLGMRDISTVKRNAVAAQIAVVHQSNTAPPDMTVRSLVMAGRTPYKKLFRTMKEEDEHIVHRALADTDMTAFADRCVCALSGGQMQRVWLAMALAQDTGILLLDEITTYLDIHYQLEILHLIRELNRKKKLTIVMVLHDINLALEFCDEVVVMKQGTVLAQGKTDMAVDEAVLDEAFGISSRIMWIDGRKYCIFRRRKAYV